MSSERHRNILTEREICFVMHSQAFRIEENLLVDLYAGTCTILSTKLQETSYLREDSV